MPNGIGFSSSPLECSTDNAPLFKEQEVQVGFGREEDTTLLLSSFSPVEKNISCANVRLIICKSPCCQRCGGKIIHSPSTPDLLAKLDDEFINPLVCGTHSQLCTGLASSQVLQLKTGFSVPKFISIRAGLE